MRITGKEEEKIPRRDPIGTVWRRRRSGSEKFTCSKSTVHQCFRRPAAPERSSARKKEADILTVQRCRYMNHLQDFSVIFDFI